MTAAPHLVRLERTLPPQVPQPRPRYAMRLFAVCVVLTGLMFVQEPGLVVPDSKLDLTLNPSGLLARAMHLWDPAGFFGQLQNQGYGYLVPSGPFFLLGELLGLPEWAVQRCWWSVLLCSAFLGAYRVAGALGMGSPATRIVAAVAFALSPRVVSGLGAISVEMWPYALAPWVVLPLVLVCVHGGSPRRAAAWSGLALLAVGGVNAAATLTTLVLPALWLLTRRPGRDRRILAAWWSGAVILATTWWVIPLVLLGRFSPPFLDWIEDAATTTAHTSLAESFAGVSHWLAYLATSTGVVWPAGFALVTGTVTVLNVAVVATLGLAGLVHPRTSERQFLLLALFAGLVLVGFGYSGSVAGYAAEVRQDWLDAALAPFRNTHKFDVVLRLPLALGLSVALARLRLPGLGREVSRRLVAVVTAAALLASAGIALVVGLAPPGGYQQVPEYWRQTARWLAEQDSQGRALVIPGSSFAQFGWGVTRDEPLQALGTSAWGVRDAVPLSSAGNIRMLDAIERRLESGQASVGLSAYLRRAGIAYLVVRNDLDWASTGAPRPLQVRAALASSPGMDVVASFGPLIGGEAETAGRTVDERLDIPLPAVEVWKVAGSNDARVRRISSTQTSILSGGPEALLELADVRRSPPATIVAGDDTAVEGVPDLESGGIVTDTPRLREVDVGSIRNNTSATLERGAPTVLDRRVNDYVVPGTEGREVAAVIRGISEVAASSSGGDVRSLRARGPEHQPWSALDGDARTAWVSGDLGPAVGQWWEVRFEDSRRLGSVTVTLLDDSALGTPVRTLRVTTDAGSRVVGVTPGVVQRLRTVPGATTFLRLTVDSVDSGSVGGGVGISEVEIPGLVPERPIEVPEAAARSSVVLGVAPGYRPECVYPVDRPLCSTLLAGVSEEQAGIHRVVSSDRTSRYDVELYVRPRYGEALERLLTFDDGRMAASASSRALASPLGRSGAAVDRDLASGWVAAPDDKNPELIVQWGEPRTVRGLQFQRDAYLPASRPERITVGLGGREYLRKVDARGFVSLPPTSASSVRIAFETVDPLVSVDARTGTERRLPVGVSEVRVLGADDLRRQIPIGLVSEIPCGFGPVVAVGGRIVQTEVRASLGDLLSEATVQARPCGQARVTVPDVPTDVVVRPSGEFDPVTLVLTPPGPDVTASLTQSAPAEVLTWGEALRDVRISVSDSDDWLVLAENYNAGWTASLEGVPLSTARIDGWAQGVLVPAGTGGVLTLRFEADRWYRLGLLLAPVGLVVLLALAFSGEGRGQRPLPPREFQIGVWLTVSALTLALLAGSTGLLLLGLAAALRRSRADRWVWPAAPLLAGAAGVVWALDPWPPPTAAGSPPVQVLMAAALACACASLLPASRVHVTGADGPAHATSAAAPSSPARTN